jgi:PAS domain S-box-containing protein
MPYDRWKQNRLFARTNKIFPRVPQIIAGIYAAVSVLWITFSDKVLAVFARDYDHYQELQTYKGWAFVTASALLIFLLLKSAWKGIIAAYTASLDSERRLQLALASAGGGIWELDLTGNKETVAFVSDELVHRLGLPPGYQVTMAELRDRRHPDDAEEADRRLSQTMSSGGKQPYDDRYRLRCEDGCYRWIHLRGNVLSTADGRPQRMVGVALDIDEQVKAQQRVGELLRYDPVTGLSKHGKFLSDLDAMLAEAASDRRVAVVQIKLLDLDRLIEDAETVQDAALIRLIGDRFHALPTVLAARITSDVFVLATPPASSPSTAQRLVRDAMEKLLKPVQTPGGCVKLRVQAGGALSPHGGDTAIGLLRNSGHALELANRTTEIEVRWFNEELSAEISTRTDRIRGLESAVPRNEIECHYQPLVDLRSGRTAGFEALARWRRMGEALLRPDTFIALAEEVGKIGEIGEEVLRQACRTAAAWPSPQPFVAVNVSPVQLEDPTFPGTVASVLRTTGLSPARLELEITENALLHDQAVALQRILALRDLGVLVAIDDFGTGYSSLALLSRSPSRAQDRPLLCVSSSNARHTIIVDAIIDLAKISASITAGRRAAAQAEMLAARRRLAWRISRALRRRSRANS